MEGREKQEQIRFKDYYQTADIVILAEDIGHGEHLDEITSFIDQFHSQLTGIFIEDTISRQESYNKYLETGEVDDELDSFFEGALREGKDLRMTTLALLDKAKQYNLPIICYDASKEKTPEASKRTRHGFYYIKGECRDEDMFDNVTNYCKNHSGKYVVIIGSHHMTDENFEGNYENFGQRIKKSLGKKCIAIKMSDSKTKEDIYDDVIVKND